MLVMCSFALFMLLVFAAIVVYVVDHVDVVNAVGKCHIVGMNLVVCSFGYVSIYDVV